MSLTVKATRTPFLPAPEGSHIARCYMVVDLGVQVNQKYNTAEEKVLIGWELDKYIGDRPFVHLQPYTARLDRGTKLLELLEGWYNKRFTKEECDDFRLSALIGQAGYLTLKQTADYHDPMKRWAQVAHIAPLPKNFVYEEAYHHPVHFDLDTYTRENFLALPEKIRSKINKSALKKAAEQLAAASAPVQNAAIMTEDSAQTAMVQEE
jgi:hypothetical protein